MSRRGGAAPVRTLAAVAVVATAVLAAPLVIGWRLEDPLRSALDARDASVRLAGGPASLLTGRFTPLTVVVHRARLGDLPAPAAAVLAAPLTPLVVVDRLPLPLAIRRLDAEGAITVEAEPR